MHYLRGTSFSTISAIMNYQLHVCSMCVVCLSVSVCVCFCINNLKHWCCNFCDESKLKLKGPKKWSNKCPNSLMLSFDWRESATPQCGSLIKLTIHEILWEKNCHWVIFHTEFYFGSWRSTAVCVRLEANMTSNLELWVKRKLEQEDNFRAADLFEI